MLKQVLQALSMECSGQSRITGKVYTSTTFVECQIDIMPLEALAIGLGQQEFAQI